MKNYYILLLCIIALASSCATSNMVDTTAIKEVVNSQNFTIESDMAQPMTTVGMSQLQNSGLLGVGNSSSNISLIGNSNTLTIKKDTIASYLPYFGERRSAGGYGRDNGAIELKGEMKNYKTEWNEKKNHYKITFQAKSNSEMFDVNIQLYPNLKTYLTLSSPSRTSITYIGQVTALKNPMP